MDDLITFIRARLSEDEQAAGELPEHMRRWTATSRWPEAGPDAVIDAAGHEVMADADDRDVRHVTRWDPERVLRLTAVLRTAIDEFSYEARETWIIMALGEALYADRLGYREEWRP